MTKKRKSKKLKSLVRLIGLLAPELRELMKDKPK